MIEYIDFVLIALAVAIGVLIADGAQHIAHNVFNQEPVTVCLPIQNMPTVVCVKGEERHP
jgi:hypothetical protein